nr:transporter substrate-binding domain-containing protein [uncultured Roseovarius sp.]
MIKKLLASTTALAMTLSSVTAAAAQCTNDTFNRILSEKKIVIGVKPDYKPWGFMNSDGELVGMEIDMAQDIADALGVELELVATKGANRIPFLETGKIDMILATMSDRADRREASGIVLPNYYASGTNVMVPKALGLTSWEDLRGRPVCGKQGAFYNKKATEVYGAELISFSGSAEGKQALRDRKCIAFLSDDSSIVVDLASGDWDDFEMPLPTEDNNPWAVAVPLDERDCAFGRFMSGMQFNWLQSGRLIELEEKWGIQPSAFLQEEHERMSDWLAE